MKNFKKVLAIILAMAMFFALSMTAFAATTVSTTEDTSVLSVTSTGNTVTYQAVTVDGGEVGGVSYPSITTYNYCVKTSNAYYAIVSFYNPNGYLMYLNNMYATNSTSYSTYLAKNGHYTLDLKTANGTLVRSFEISIVDAASVNVTIEINCYNAVDWLSGNTSSAVSSAITSLDGHFNLNDEGKMVSVVSLTNLPAGSTAMDALLALFAQVDAAHSGDPNYIPISYDGWYSGNEMTYLTAIDGLEASMCGDWSGWCYVSSTNTSPYYYMPMVGASAYYLTEGEHIIWVYTCDFADIDDAING